MKAHIKVVSKEKKDFGLFRKRNQLKLISEAISETTVVSKSTGYQGVPKRN